MRTRPFRKNIIVDTNVLNNTLITAASWGYIAPIDILLKLGADINISHQDLTPLHLAVMNGNLPLVQFLLEKKVNIFMPWLLAGGNRTALHIAADQGNFKIVQALVQHDPTIIDATCSGGLTALHIAAEKGFFHTLKFLVENKANIHAVDAMGRTVLHYAIIHNHFSCLKFLLDKGADINAIDSKGNTALSLAVSKKDTAVIEELLQRGAKPNSKAFITSLFYDNLDLASKFLDLDPTFAQEVINAQGQRIKTIIIFLNLKSPFVYTSKHAEPVRFLLENDCGLPPEEVLQNSPAWSIPEIQQVFQDYKNKPLVSLNSSTSSASNTFSFHSSQKRKPDEDDSAEENNNNAPEKLRRLET